MRTRFMIHACVLTVLIASILVALNVAVLYYTPSISSKGAIFAGEILSKPEPTILLELAISRRQSIRSYFETEVPQEMVLDVLWASYGRSLKGRTVPSLCGDYPLIIYVCNSTAAYKYNPETHSLDFWKSGDYRNGDYNPQCRNAPIQLYIALDTSVCGDLYWGHAEAGCLIQSIYLEANAQNLGTVCLSLLNASKEAIQSDLGLPANQQVFYDLPLGWPAHPYVNYQHMAPTTPPGSPELPEIKNSSTFLEDALDNRTSSHDWNGMPLTDQGLSQILWSAYGYSYLFDTVGNKIHRVVPSAHGSYPMTIYAANSSAIYEYLPSQHSITLRVQGDKRTDIASAVGQGWVSSAPFTLIIVWNDQVMEMSERHNAYTEMGLIMQNVHLESTAWDLIADWAPKSPGDIDEDDMRAVLGLSNQTNLHPIGIISVGHSAAIQTISHPPTKSIYEVKLDLNTTINQGARLQMKFYDYDGEFQVESTVWSGTTPAHVELYVQVPHPLNLSIEIAALVLTDAGGDEIYTLTIFKMRGSHLMERLAKLDEDWVYVSSEQRSTIFMEIIDVDAQWPYAPP